jgi:hypothetical protein
VTGRVIDVQPIAELYRAKPKRCWGDGKPPEKGACIAWRLGFKLFGNHPKVALSDAGWRVARHVWVASA